MSWTRHCIPVLDDFLISVVDRAQNQCNEKSYDLYMVTSHPATQQFMQLLPHLRLSAS